MKDQKWTYKKSIARAERAIKKWDRVTLEIIGMLYKEKEQLSAQKGQDKDEWADDFTPSWKHYCGEVNMPPFFIRAVKEYNAMSEFIAQEKKAAAKKNKRRRG